MKKYIPPEFGSNAFNCMHCGVLTKQLWLPLVIKGIANQHHLGWMSCFCDHCHKSSYWYHERMVIPSHSTAPVAHEDFPDGPKADYDEAREIAGLSPKAAAALLRLCLQKLMVELGEKGKNINDDIQSLVKKGVPEFVQQALDFCRVVGNNAVHPGEIVIDDTPEIALALFEMLNVIVEHRIAMPKRIREQYNELPEAARRAIEKRDAKPVE